MCVCVPVQVAVQEQYPIDYIASYTSREQYGCVEELKMPFIYIESMIPSVSLFLHANYHQNQRIEYGDEAIPDRVLESEYTYRI